MNPLGLRTRMEEWRTKLFEYREQRIHPLKDDKVLTSWNGLMIAALALGAKALQKPEYAKAAERAADFIWDKLRREDGRLLARYRDGESAIPAYVDDYAFLIWGLSELYEATGQAVYLERALTLKDGMLELFLDTEGGGFFFTGHDGEKLPVRSKELYDGAIPSGNSVAAKLLWKLSVITQDMELKEIAERTAAVLASAASEYPPGYAMYLQAHLGMVSGGREWVLSGKKKIPRCTPCSLRSSRPICRTQRSSLTGKGTAGRCSACCRIWLTNRRSAVKPPPMSAATSPAVPRLRIRKQSGSCWLPAAVRYSRIQQEQPAAISGCS
ncbi:hypothetical protein ACFTAO_27150 [Paenibacillus rhizoplanae]